MDRQNLRNSLIKIYSKYLFVFPIPPPSRSERYSIYLGDVGGQRTLRPYWRNYFEQTDAIVWVVDSGDRLRMEDCKHELHSLLQEDVGAYFIRTLTYLTTLLAISGSISPCVR